LGKVPINQFLALYIPDKPGPIVNAAGVAVGQHRGLHRYTIGQRKGLDVPSNADNEHYVVVAKDYDANVLRVAFDHPGTPGLYQDEARVHSFSWVNVPVSGECDLPVRVRYRDAATLARIIPDGAGGARVVFRETQRGIASGQVMALYGVDGETLLGGGVFY
jgi:tRNA-specific 2-thiouridylase